jgi:hypothetical protein
MGLFVCMYIGSYQRIGLSNHLCRFVHFFKKNILIKGDICVGAAL